MLQFDLQFYEELTVAWVRTVKFISGAFFWPTGQLVLFGTDSGNSLPMSLYVFGLFSDTSAIQVPFL